jgi:hypothetical protein
VLARWHEAVSAHHAEAPSPASTRGGKLDNLAMCPKDGCRRPNNDRANWAIDRQPLALALLRDQNKNRVGGGRVHRRLGVEIMRLIRH